MKTVQIVFFGNDFLNILRILKISDSMDSLSKLSVFQRLMRPGLWSRDQDHRDRDSNFQSLETQTHRDQRISKLARLNDLVVVETETH